MAEKNVNYKRFKKDIESIRDKKLRIIKTRFNKIYNIKNILI